MIYVAQVVRLADFIHAQLKQRGVKKDIKMIDSMLIAYGRIYDLPSLLNYFDRSRANHVEDEKIFEHINSQLKIFPLNKQF